MLNSIPIVVSSCCSHVVRFWHIGAGTSEYLVWIIEAIICPDLKGNSFGIYGRYTNVYILHTRTFMIDGTV